MSYCKWKVRAGSVEGFSNFPNEVRLRGTFPTRLPSPGHLSILPTFGPCIGCYPWMRKHSRACVARKTLS